MLQPGEETISVNIAHWKDIDGTMTKEDIAIGDVPAGLKKADAFTVDISLFGENPQIIFTQGEKSYAYNKETNPQLANIARGQISDVYGRTYLNIASFEATGALKELKFTSIRITSISSVSRYVLLISMLKEPITDRSSSIRMLFPW